MNNPVISWEVKRLIRQRNSFILLGVMSLLLATILSILLLRKEDKIIMVPGINQQIWLSSSGVSNSYLQETAAMYLPLLLDLSPEAIDWKKQLIFSHVSTSDDQYMRSLSRYFNEVKQKYKKYNLSTHFIVKKLEVSEKAMSVKASGQLISNFGNNGYDSKPVVYFLSFERVGSKLLLREFVSLNDGKDNDKEAASEDI